MQSWSQVEKEVPYSRVRARGLFGERLGGSGPSVLQEAGTGDEE